MYGIDFSNQSKKFLKSLNRHLTERIIEKIEKLVLDPVPSDAKFLGRNQGDKVFRIRVGDYRALYKIKEKEKIILMVKIDKRPRVYN